MKICTVIGARPQFIKASALSKEIRKREDIEEVLIHTGQHFDRGMSDIFFAELQIPAPAYNLAISGLSHGAMTGRMMEELEKVFLKEKPDIVVLYGDTNSTLAGALTAAKLHIPIAHIEAGLRSGNMNMPEEVNRILTDRVSTWLFTPSQLANDNLKKEGIPFEGQKVEVVGDIMYDVFLNVKRNISSGAFLSEKGIDKDKFIVATLHRQETVDNPVNLRSVVKALDEINDEIKVMWPVHPRTQAKLKEFEIHTNVTLIDPVSYTDMVRLLLNCRMVITDSGGLQKEAYYAGKRCIVIRNETEWKELLDTGKLELAGYNQDLIVDKFNKFNNTKSGMRDLRIYGDGIANLKILNILNKGVIF